MGWYMRLVEDGDVYKPQECPFYPDSDEFSIKFFYGGNLDKNSRHYVGGSVVFFDSCNADEISMLELNSMLKEVGELDRDNKFWYRQPNHDREDRFFELNNDAELLKMCAQIPDLRYVNIYVTKNSAEENCPGKFIHDRNKNTGGIDREFADSTQNEVGLNEQTKKVDQDICTDYSEKSDKGSLSDNESDDESFHSDHSNKDESDDDLIFDLNVDDFPDEFPDEYHSRLDDDDEDNCSVYAQSDEERMACNSTDEEEISYPIFNEDVDMERPTFERGMCFKSSLIFRKAVKQHAILDRRPIRTVRNFGKKVKYVCEPPCQWQVYASTMQNSSTFQIKTLYNKHTCMPTFDQKQINSTWIAEYYEKDIRMNPTWPIQAFHKKIVNDLKCHVSKHAVYRAKTKALIKINGTHAEQYSKIWDYAYQLRKILPESTIKILTESPEPGVERGRFLRFYVCLEPVKKAFVHHCRHIVGLDGCHLKGLFGGQLLAAVGVDANDGMYPIAWAVVEAENTESWTWFLQFLCQDIQIVSDFAWTFISDRQKGLINALESVVPNAEHRFCVMHLYQNMHKEHKGIALRQLLWKAARATTTWELNLHMEKMKQVSSKCYEWLMAKPREQWSRSSFRTISCSDMFVNNHCEVFNSSIRKYRDLPILTMLREIHKAVMKRIQARRDKMAGLDCVICPNAQKKLNKAIQYAGTCAITWSGGRTYSVTCSDGGHELVVDLFKKTCSCRKWDLTGIPCYHACACIALRNDPWDIHINNCYKKDMYMKLYSYTLEPIVGPEFWEEANEPKPLPPNVKVQTGRPKKKRSRKNDIAPDSIKLQRQSTKVRCTYCRTEGHNARTCHSKKIDMRKQASSDGVTSHIGKSTVKCKKCKQEGHNSRTCSLEKQATYNEQT